MKQMRHKRPNPHARFSWGRVVGDGGTVTYRLFRRDMNRALHASLHRFPADADRRDVAQKLRAMRRELLQRVDNIELHLLGVAQ